MNVANDSFANCQLNWALSVSQEPRAPSVQRNSQTFIRIRLALDRNDHLFVLILGTNDLLLLLFLCEKQNDTIIYIIILYTKYNLL